MIRETALIYIEPDSGNGRENPAMADGILNKNAAKLPFPEVDIIGSFYFNLWHKRTQCVCNGQRSCHRDKKCLISFHLLR